MARSTTIFLNGVLYNEFPFIAPPVSFLRKIPGNSRVVKVSTKKKEEGDGLKTWIKNM